MSSDRDLRKQKKKDATTDRANLRMQTKKAAATARVALRKQKKTETATAQAKSREQTKRDAASARIESRRRKRKATAAAQSTTVRPTKTDAAAARTESREQATINAEAVPAKSRKQTKKDAAASRIAARKLTKANAAAARTASRKRTKKDAATARIAARKRAKTGAAAARTDSPTQTRKDAAAARIDARKRAKTGAAAARTASRNQAKTNAAAARATSQKQAKKDAATARIDARKRAKPDAAAARTASRKQAKTDAAATQATPPEQTKKSAAATRIDARKQAKANAAAAQANSRRQAKIDAAAARSKSRKQAKKDAATAKIDARKQARKDEAAARVSSRKQAKTDAAAARASSRKQAKQAKKEAAAARNDLRKQEKQVAAAARLKAREEKKGDAAAQLAARKEKAKKAAIERLGRLLLAAGSDGDERVIGIASKIEKTGTITPEEAKSVRFQAYGELIGWHQARVDAGTVADGVGAMTLGKADVRAANRAARPKGSPSKSERGDKPAGPEAKGADGASSRDQRREARARAGDWRRENRQRRIAALKDASNPVAKAAAEAIDALGRAEDLHETRMELDLLATFWASHEEVTAIPTPLLQKLLTFSERLIDPHVPAELYTHLQETDPFAPGIEGLLTRRTAREANGPLRNTDLISLGRNCLPWTLPNRWGLRRSEHALTLDCPFNLAVHIFDATIEAIRSNFDGYADLANLTTIETQNGARIARNRRYRALWNHERNEYWLDNDYANLRRHLEQRVSNFRAATRSGRKLAFVIATDEFEEDEMRERLIELYEALRANTEAADLVLISFSHDPDGEAGVQTLGSSIFRVCRPMPSVEYIWPAEADYSSPEGIAFERNWIADLRGVLAGRGFD